jgi:hypothetical protein
MAAAEPVTAFLCARFVFDEHLSGGASGIVGVSVGLFLMVCGVVLCSMGRPTPAPPVPVPVTPAAVEPVVEPVAERVAVAASATAAARGTDPERPLTPSGAAAGAGTAGCEDDDGDCLPPPVLGIGVPLGSKRHLT